jgi:hypothetical protein
MAESWMRAEYYYLYCRTKGMAGKSKILYRLGLGRNQPQSKLAPTAEFIQLRGPQLILERPSTLSYVGMDLWPTKLQVYNLIWTPDYESKKAID